MMVASLVVAVPCPAADSQPGWAWWPAQTLPKGLVTVPGRLYEGKGALSRRAQSILVESLAGLAAQGVNEKGFDELVWSDEARPSYKGWLADFKARTGIADRGSLSPWDLAKQLTQAGLVKGYILYQPDTSVGHTLTERESPNGSLNAATTAAGVLDGILITADMEDQAKAIGLTQLLDARDKTEAWAFDQFKDQLNPHYLLLQDSRLPENRDVAIAHRIAAVYAIDSPLPEILNWMGPMGTIFGWYADSEDKSVGIASKAGEIVVASDYTMNLPVLSAGSSGFLPQPPKAPLPDAARIEKEAQGPAVAFMLSDGDNLQWLLGGFTDSPHFWANTERDAVPFGWTYCPGDLDLMAPDALAYIWKTKPAHASLVAHAGYFYPDLFAQNFAPAQRRDLLRQLAVRIGGMMNATGTHLLTFICMHCDSDEAHDAYRILAQNIPGLQGVFPIQFDPYEGGEGKTFWEPDGADGEVPFVTARYSLWANSSNRPRGGSPTKIAGLINDDARNSADDPLAAWTIVHAWSGFSPDDHSTEDHIPTDTSPGAAVGPAAAALCAKMLSPQVTVVDPEELVWIERWRHDQAQTRKLLQGP